MEDRAALAAAVAVARGFGLRVEDPVILRDQLNVLVHLRPAPVVARVAGTITRARQSTAWQERELSVAAHLTRAGAPVVAPSAELPPGPHVHDGRVLSFWEYASPSAPSTPRRPVRRSRTATRRCAATTARCRCSAR